MKTGFRKEDGELKNPYYAKMRHNPEWLEKQKEYHREYYQVHKKEIRTQQNADHALKKGKTRKPNGFSKTEFYCPNCKELVAAVLKYKLEENENDTTVKQGSTGVRRQSLSQS